MGCERVGPLPQLTMRQATPKDAEAIAAVFSPSLRLLGFLPILHTEQEDRRFIEDIILRDCVVTVAHAGGAIVSFLARQGEEIRLLYTHPDFTGKGAGAMLLNAAKESGVTALELWCFQQNHGARRFYERYGFATIRFTDGRDNEEKMPDLLFRWENIDADRALPPGAEAA